MDNRISALEAAVASLARSGERTNAQLEELIRIGERQLAQKEALERAFTQIGHVAARAEEKRLRIQALEDAHKRAEEDRRERDRDAAEIERRVASLEIKAPGLEQVRRWVVFAILAVVGAAASLVWSASSSRAPGELLGAPTRPETRPALATSEPLR